MSLLLSDLDDSVIIRAGTFHAWASLCREANGQGRESAEWLSAMDDNRRRPRTILFDEVHERLSLTEAAEKLKRRHHEELATLFSPTPGFKFARCSSIHWMENRHRHEQSQRPSTAHQVQGDRDRRPSGLPWVSRLLTDERSPTRVCFVWLLNGVGARSKEHG